MKKSPSKIVLLTFLAATACQANLISIGISPTGFDNAVGLSPANEVPAVTNSTGSGGSISSGITFDTDTSILQLDFGYGSAAGFADLTGPATGVSLNGPAMTNQVGAQLFDLMPLNTPATNAALGGVVSGSLIVSSNAVADLMNGLDYINISTASNTNGEIRGQLIPLVSIVNCPGDATVECGDDYTNLLTVQDLQGLAMEVIWSVDGIAVQTNQIAAGNPTNTYDIGFDGALPSGTNSLDISVADSAGGSASCSATVIVSDTIPPVIVLASASPNVLWPPNHKMVKVTVSAVVSDNCGGTSWKIINVQSSETVFARGSGHTAPDWKIINDHTVDLRAERSGNGPGRIYSITIQAEDTAGNLSTPQVVTVTVPHDQGKGQGNGKNKGHGHGH